MPTFFAQKTTVQLSVADLGRATTPNPRTQQSFAASESIRNVAQEFARGSKDGTLTETPLYAEDGSHLHFLGKHGNMPFFMVHAGKNLFDSTTKEKRNRRPARIPLAGASEGESTSTAANMNGETIGIRTSQNASIEPNPKYKPPFTPHALCLTVFLSTSSFVHTKNTVAERVEINDVKIDVYFNGALCDSRYVPRRYSGEAYSMTEHIVRFTGRRIGRLIEKPWVIVPSGQNPDGDLREYRRGKVAYAGTQQRWNDVSDALLVEADKIGRDEMGQRPVIGEYLEGLAELSMPKEVEDMQKAGGPKFGVLDVVVIWGKGSKDGPDAPYIVEPTPIKIEGFTSVNMDQSMKNHPSTQSVTTSPYNAYAVPQSRSEALANANSIDDYSDTSPLSTITPSSVPISNNKTTTPAAFSPPDKRSVPALPFETPIKRSRGHYYDVLTTKQTLSEEIDSIATAAILTNARITRARTADSSSPLSSTPMTRVPTPAQTKVVTLKLPSPTTRPGRMNVPGMQDRVGKSELLTPFEKRTPAPDSKRRERAPTQLNADRLDRGFVVPALGVDCSTTYASSGIVRNVGAARGGVFKEGGVVMGARFVVGG